MSLCGENNDIRRTSMIRTILNYCTNLTYKTQQVLDEPTEADAYDDDSPVSLDIAFSPPKRARNKKLSNSFFRGIETEWNETAMLNRYCISVINIHPEFAQNNIVQREANRFIREIKDKYRVVDFSDKTTDCDVDKELLLLSYSPSQITSRDIFDMKCRIERSNLKFGVCIVNPYRYLKVSKMKVDC